MGVGAEEPLVEPNVEALLAEMDAEELQVEVAAGEPREGQCICLVFLSIESARVCSLYSRFLLSSDVFLLYVH